jgi:biotin carboxylase
VVAVAEPLAEVVPDNNRQQARSRLLLIAPPNSYRTVSYLESARRQGIDILVASEGEHSLVSAIASGLHVDLDAPEALELLLAANRERPFNGVVATDDTTVELGSRLAEILGLPHNPPQAALYSHRKDLSREILQAAGVRVPEFRVLDLTAAIAPQLQGLGLPCVVKPLALSASRGVIRADTQQQVQSACQQIRSIVRGEGIAEDYVASHVLAEAFISGPEVALEGLLHRGKLDVLAIFDKPDPLEGPFFEETYYITPSRHAPAIREEIMQCVREACDGLGLREGPVHAEVRIGKSGCVIIEVAARTIGGECARLLNFGTGHSLEDLVIAHATGGALSIERSSGAAGVLMIPITQAGSLRRIEGITRARAVPFIEDILINIRDGYELVPLPEGSSYLGFMFACAPTPEQVEAALRAAHAELEIVVAPLIRIEDRREA